MVPGCLALCQRPDLPLPLSPSHWLPLFESSVLFARTISPPTSTSPTLVLPLRSHQGRLLCPSAFTGQLHIFPCVSTHLGGWRELPKASRKSLSPAAHTPPGAMSAGGEILPWSQGQVQVLRSLKLSPLCVYRRGKGY